MKNEQKKLIRILILILLFIVIGLTSNKVYAKSYSINNMDIQVTILENGSINVRQAITYSFSGQYNGIYITVPYTLQDNEQSDNNSIYNGNSIKIKKVYDSNGINYTESAYASNGVRGKYTLDKDPEKYTLKVYSPSQNVIKTFTIEYEISNICVKYIDVGELYYNFIGGKWDVTIANLNIDIYLPNNKSKDNLYAFGHGPYNGQVTIISNNRVNFKVKDVKRGQYVATRLVFDTSNIKGSTKTVNKYKLQEIMQEEKNIYERKEEKQKFTNGLLVFAIALFVYWIILLFVFENDKKYIAANSSEQELFEKYNPLIAGCIQGSREILSRDIIAVILNLIDKKIIEIEVIPSLSRINTYHYELKGVEEKRNEMDKIEEYVYDWVLGNTEQTRIPSKFEQMAKDKNANKKFKELNKLAKNKLNNIGANIAKVPLFIRIINTLILLASIIFVIKDINNNIVLLQTGGGYGFETIDTVLLLFYIIMLCPILLYIPIYLLIATRHRVSKIVRKFTGQKVAITSISILLIFLIIIILTAVFMKNTKFLIIDELLICISTILVFTDNLMLKNDVTIIEDYSKLNMLKNKLQDDKLFQDRDIEQIVLWGKYLAYSVAFGVSSKIAKKMKELNIDDDLEILLQDEKMFNHIYYGYNDFYRYASLDKRFLESYSNVVNKMGSSGFSGGSRRRIFTVEEAFHGGGGSGRRPEEHFKFKENFYEYANCIWASWNREKHIYFK